LEILKLLEKESCAGGIISLGLLREAEMRKLNKIYRRKDKSTDVLSFPTKDGVDFPGGARGELGDIFICPAAAKKKFGNAWKKRINHLFLHGALHLLGFDHQTDLQSKKMERLEKKILSRMQ